MSNPTRRSSRFKNRIFSGLLLAASISLACPASAADQLNPVMMDTAAQMIHASGAPGGIITIIDGADADLALALAKQGSFIIQCLAVDSGTCDTLRKSIRAHGMYGTVSANTLDAARLPYAGNLVNIGVVNADVSLAKNRLNAKDVLRVLAPLGTVFVSKSPAGDELVAALRAAGAVVPAKVAGPAGWTILQKPWPANIDEWTHYLHGPDGNPVAQDQVVGPPAQYQWIDGPNWLKCHETDSSVSTLVTAQGRLFSIVDEGPISLAGPHALPDKWSLIARDAFNGVVLWKVPIRRWGWREWKPTWFNTRPGDVPLNIQKRLVAVGDYVYVTLGYQAPVSQLDARTGEILQTYAGTERTGEILDFNGTLVLSVHDGKQDRVMAVDTVSGKTLWKSQKTYRGSTVDYIKWKESNNSGEPAELDPALNMATDGQTIALLDGPQIVALDFRTGAEKWHSVFPLDDADKNAGGIDTQGNLWVGTMIVQDGVVLHASPNKLAGLAADTGKLLWSQPKKFIGHLWYEWKEVYVIGGLVWTWGADLATEPLGETGTKDAGFEDMEAGASAKKASKAGKKTNSTFPKNLNGYDLHTGAMKKQVALGNIFKANHHHRCYRDKATVNYILASRRGTEFVDLNGGKHSINNWVRTTCHVGFMPANGLQYVPQHPCQCYIDEKLNGFLALAAHSDAELTFTDKVTPRCEQGPAFADIANLKAQDAKGADWPAFRHDAARTGAVQTHVPEKLTPLWRVKAGDRVSPPIAVGSRVYVSLIDEHHIVCLDAGSGKQVWEFAAGGRIDSSPTYYRGTLLFGSADGWVYCVRAADGQLAWRFRGSPTDRLIGAYGQLESAWPVHGSVLVQKDTVYFASGRSSHLDGGIRLYGLDPATGQLRYQTKLEGPDYNVDNLKENNKPPEGALSDILVGDGSGLFMRSESFDNSLKPRQSQPKIQIKGGFLDDSYFKRAPWSFGTARDYASLLVYDSACVYCMRMFDSLKGLDPKVFFMPADKGYQMFARPVNATTKKVQNTWANRVSVRVRAMVLVADRLIAAGPPDIIDPQDPLGAFEGRAGGLLYVMNSGTGAKLSELKLPSPPVFNGAAAANSRLFITAEDGSVACYGGVQP